MGQRASVPLQACEPRAQGSAEVHVKQHIGVNQPNHAASSLTLDRRAMLWPVLSFHGFGQHHVVLLPSCTCGFGLRQQVVLKMRLCIGLRTNVLGDALFERLRQHGQLVALVGSLRKALEAAGLDDGLAEGHHGVGHLHLNLAVQLPQILRIRCQGTSFLFSEHCSRRSSGHHTGYRALFEVIASWQRANIGGVNTTNRLFWPRMARASAYDGKGHSSPVLLFLVSGEKLAFMMESRYSSPVPRMACSPDSSTLVTASGYDLLILRRPSTCVPGAAQQETASEHSLGASS